MIVFPSKKKWKNWFEDISIFFEIKFIDPILNIKRTFFRFFRNLKDWFPILISDQQWDYQYLYIALQHKLKLMRTFFNSDKTHLMDSKKVANEIHLCVLLLDRLIKNEYDTNAFINHDKKWGEIQMNWTPCEDESGYNELHVWRSKVTPETEKQEIKESKLVSEHANKMEVQDIEYLCKIISKHVRGWWD